MRTLFLIPLLWGLAVTTAANAAGPAPDAVTRLQETLEKLDQLDTPLTEAVKAKQVRTAPSGFLEPVSGVVLERYVSQLLKDVNAARDTFFILKAQMDKTAKDVVQKRYAEERRKAEDIDPSTAQPLLTIAAPASMAERLAYPLLAGFFSSLGYDRADKIPMAGGYKVAARKLGRASQDFFAVKDLGNHSAFVELAAGHCDLAMTTRAATTEENATLFRASSSAPLADMRQPGYVTVVARDAFVLVTNQKSALEKSIQLSSLKTLVEGRDARLAFLHPAGPAEEDLADFLLNRLTATSRPGPPSPSGSSLIEQVAQRANGFALIPFEESSKLPPEVNRVSIFANSLPGARAYSATPMHIRTEDYPLTRQILLCTTKNRKLLAKRLRDFVAGSGQAKVAEAGLVDQGPVNPTSLTDWDKDRDEMLAAYETKREFADYVKLLKPCDRASTPFVLNFAKSKDDHVEFYAGLDPSALQNVRNLVKQMALVRSPGTIVLIGHTDAIGRDSEDNKILGQNRANNLRLELISMGLQVDEVTRANSMGPKLNVALNNTESEKQRNRRVELWIKRKRAIP